MYLRQVQKVAVMNVDERGGYRKMCENMTQNNVDDTTAQISLKLKAMESSNSDR